jgi:hypothetical protein
MSDNKMLHISSAIHAGFACSRFGHIDGKRGGKRFSAMVMLADTLIGLKRVSSADS